jgi:tRNA wybutosine-synthesizing protein 3
MKIAPSRYKIYLNDNKVTSFQLVDLADRVCLGLLPSSEDGWPLAVRAIKPAGGFIHVHENVHEDNLETWKVFCMKKFEKYFLDAGKSMRINCTWVEKVKSYSPRVWHIVADLTCICEDSSK